MKQAAIQQAVFQTYLDPLQKIIDRQAAYYLWLSDRDLMAMNDQQARSHFARLKQAGEDIETLTNVKAAADEMFQFYHEQYSIVVEEINRLRAAISGLNKNVISLQQALTSGQDIETFQHIINLLQHERTRQSTEQNRTAEE